MATQEKEALRGSERIQQLMEEFPEISRSLVVKAEALREGIKPSAASRLVGRWALPDAKWYFQYDKEDTHTPEETAEGYTLSPVVCFLSQEVSWHVMFDSRSPYEVRYEERGRYQLYRDGEPIEEAFFSPRPQWYDKKTSSGVPMSSVIALRSEESMFMAALTHCQYFNDNLGCRYCNINPSEVTKEGMGLERVTAKREQDIYETFVAACQENPVPIRSLGLSGGVILDSSKEADMYARIIKTLKRAMQDVGRQVPIVVVCQAMEAEDQMKLKEAGASRIGFNLEVWEPRLFEWLCPGKTKYVGREKWLEAMLSSVKIFGTTSTSFVHGLEMAPPYGFKDEDETEASALEGCRWMLEHGVMLSATFWRPVPGTEFAGMYAPRTEYLLRTELARHKLTVKYNKAPKRGKPNTVGQTIHSDFPHVDLPGAQAAGPARASSSQEAC